MSLAVEQRTVEREGSDEESKEDDKGDPCDMYLDYICSNDRSQDRLAICTILDGALCRIRNEFPVAKEISIITDNGNCYQNDLLVDTSPFLRKFHNFHMKVIIHPAPQCGKSNADIHFAVAMRNIQRYLKEQEAHVYCPIHVITDLEYDRGLANLYTEFCNVNREPNGLGDMVKAIE